MARGGRRHPVGRQPQPPAPIVAPQQPVPQNEAQARYLQAQWIGPLPPPAILRDYDGLLQNGAERVFHQFEEEGRHRRDKENRDVRLKVRAVHIGQGLAGAFALGTFLLTAYAIHEQAQWAAVVLGGSTLVSGVSAFLGLGIRRKPRE